MKVVDSFLEHHDTHQQEADTLLPYQPSGAAKAAANCTREKHFAKVVKTAEC